MAAGYSGTPLAKKLGIKDGHDVAVLHEPAEFRGLLEGLPEGVQFVEHPASRSGGADSPDVSVAFFIERADLERDLDALAQAAFPDRTIWLAWPKKTSGVETDLTGDVVREVVLATKLVDVKVCAISEVWSGLKVVWRKEHR